MQGPSSAAVDERFQRNGADPDAAMAPGDTYPVASISPVSTPTAANADTAPDKKKMKRSTRRALAVLVVELAARPRHARRAGQRPGRRDGATAAHRAPRVRVGAGAPARRGRGRARPRLQPHAKSLTT